MQLTSVRTKGYGRGKLLGFPTINLVIPPNLTNKTGIYAGEVKINGETFEAAVHYGPVPTFGQESISLEVFLLDAVDSDIPNVDQHQIELTMHKWLRDIITFNNTDDLVNQIHQDVNEVRKFFKRV